MEFQKEEAGNGEKQSSHVTERHPASESGGLGLFPKGAEEQKFTPGDATAEPRNTENHEKVLEAAVKTGALERRQVGGQPTSRQQ